MSARRHLAKAWQWIRRSARGATGVEYALLVSLVVVVSIGTIEVMSDESRDEVNNQADCISTRPPPPGCQLEPLVTTTTNSIPVTNTTQSPTSSPPTTAPTTLPPRPSTATIPRAVSVPTGPGAWRAEANIVIRDADGVLVSGAVVDVAVYVDGQGPFFISCTTDLTGGCLLAFDVPFSNAAEVVFKFQAITTDPPVGALPGDLTFVNPL